MLPPLSVVGSLRNRLAFAYFVGQAKAAELLYKIDIEGRDVYAVSWTKARQFRDLAVGWGLQVEAKKGSSRGDDWEWEPVPRDAFDSVE